MLFNQFLKVIKRKLIALRETINQLKKILHLQLIKLSNL